MWKNLLEWLFVKVTPRLMLKYKETIMKSDVMSNQVMPEAFKIRKLRLIWKSFCNSFADILGDWSNEVRSCSKWADNMPIE